MTPPVTGTVNVEVSESELENPFNAVGVEAGVVAVCVGVLVGVFVAVAKVTMTWKLPETLLPASSVEEQLTFVVPRGKVAPEAGEQITETDWSMSSRAETE
jgi:hypothetical protein